MRIVDVRKHRTTLWHVLERIRTLPANMYWEVEKREAVKLMRVLDDYEYFNGGNVT